MKKYLLMLFGIVSFLGINTVKADTIDNFEYFYMNFDYAVNYLTTYETNISDMVNYWEQNLSSEYPYYAIVINDNFNSTSCYPTLNCPISLYYSTSNKIISSGSDLVFDSHYIQFPGNPSYPRYTYYPDSNTYENFYPSSLSDGKIYPPVVISISPFSDPQSYNGFKLLKSNMLIYSLSTTLNIPSYTSDTLNFSINEFEITTGDLFPTLSSLIDGSYINNLNNNYIEINLNDYSYVALSLKDYDTIPDNNYSIYSNIYVKGQLCITPVYNYGMTERKDILTGTQIQGCSEYYNDFTLTRMYILKDDVENHAIYYLKAYDTSKDNTVKVDKSFFNISYITEENKDNPQVNINGKIYPTLPYYSLTDTSTKSEDEGYTSGVSCAIGDFNCYSEYNPENLFDKIFSSPLDILKGIWSSITNVFSIIPYFLNLLPDTMQSFLYLSFMIAIIIGLLKILL